jgi:hypothetical protein
MRNTSSVKLCFLIGFALFITTANADAYTIATTQAPQTIGIISGSPRFVLGLDYPSTFEITIDSLDNPKNYFCEPSPSQVNPVLQWQGNVALEGGNSFDNAVFYNNYYFLLDTLSFRIIATQDFTSGERKIIESDFKNSIESSEEYYEVFLVLDDMNGVLYIITEKYLLSYELNSFFDAVKNNKAIPKITKAAKKYGDYVSISSVKYYQGLLYIVADNLVHIWFTASNGDVDPLKQKFDDLFFDAASISVVDIAFQGNHAFVLDSLAGVYAVDISGAKQQNFRRIGLQVHLSKGQFIEIVGTSLNIVTSTKKTTTLHEFIIGVDKNNEFTLGLNRQIDIYQAVSSVQSDGNFLYLITGFFNMAVRTGIPGNYDSDFVEGYIMNYWTLFEIKSLITVKKGTSSQVVAVQNDGVSVYLFEQDTPVLVCNTWDILEGDYNFQLKLYQTQCDSKETDDINIVCQTKQNIRFVVASNAAALGDVTRSSKVSLGLGVGLGFMALLIIIFICLVRKYKSQYQTLESRFKFQKLKDLEGQDHSESTGRSPASRAGAGAGDQEKKNAWSAQI